MKRFFPCRNLSPGQRVGAAKAITERSFDHRFGDLLNACLESLMCCPKVACIVLVLNIPSPFVRKPSLVFVKGVPGRKGFLANSGHMVF